MCVLLWNVIPTLSVCLSAWNYPEEEADMHSVRKKAGWDYSEPVNSVIVLCIRRRPAEHLPVQANLDTADRVNRRWRRRNEEEKVKISRKATLGDHSFHLSQQSASRRAGQWEVEKGDIPFIIKVIMMTMIKFFVTSVQFQFGTEPCPFQLIRFITS